MNISAAMFGLGSIMVLLALIVQLSGQPIEKVIHLDLLGAIFLLIAIYYK